MDSSDFETAERHILGNAPAAHWRMFEMRLRLAREKLACGSDVTSEIAALEAEVARASARPGGGDGPLLDS